MLLERALLTVEQVEEINELCRETGQEFGFCVTDHGYIEEDELVSALADCFSLPVVNINATDITPDILSAVPVEIIQRFRCFPLGFENGSLKLAISDPTCTEVYDEVRFACGRVVRPVLATASSIRESIEKHYDVTVEKILKDMVGDDDDNASGGEEFFIHDLREKASEPTLINLVNLVLSQAIQDGASDVHIEIFDEGMKVKYRIDGILHEIPPPPKNLQPAIVSRIKIMAGMDIAQRHIPQDGHIRINLPNQQVDIRVNSVPTIFGECVVMRLLNKNAMLISLEKLGLSDENFTRFDSLLSLSHGIALVCGPTGSGKTTTLYAALSRIYTPEKKMITIEDPVEYQLAGINQIPVRPSRGLTFAAGLRAILRQDPDILMVGEIRDLETAEIAIRSALTGHLVFSTLHTNDAISAVTRLVDMGVEPFLIASSLQGVLAQRLVRRLCHECREPIVPDPSMLAQFGREPQDVKGVTFYQARGCEVCRNRGYAGREGIFELLLISETLRRMILNHESNNAIKEAAGESMQPMREDGWRKLCTGDTSFEEVLRTTQRELVEDEIV